MKSDEADPVYETLEIGTPLDYTGDVYKIYFEVRDCDDLVYGLLTEFLGTDKAEGIIRLAHGYEVELPIQCVPDVIRLISSKNIALYQVVRYAKTSATWG